MIGAGVELLRGKRGDQRVTFGDVCDHLEDFRGRSPEHAAAIDAFASFLAHVEDVDHEHHASENSTLAPGEARDVPA